MLAVSPESVMEWFVSKVVLGVLADHVVVTWILYSTWESLASLVVQLMVAPVEVMLVEATAEIVGGVVSGGAKVVKVEIVD